jgi:hypothetical protein
MKKINKDGSLVVVKRDGTGFRYLKGQDRAKVITYLKERMRAYTGRWQGYEAHRDKTGEHGVCTVCHTRTLYHNSTSITPPLHHEGEDCTDCHPHRKGFPSFTTVWNPVKRWVVGLLETNTAYASPPGLENHRPVDTPPTLKR